MPSISSIAIIIKASVKPFLKGLKKAMRGTIKFTSSIVDLTKEIVKYGAALVAITLGALTLFLKKQFAIIDAVAKTGRALGLTVDFLEGMKFAGTQLGVSQEKIIKSLKRFTRTMGEAKLGFGTGQTAFKAWSKSINDFKNLNVEKAFISVAKELRKVKDPTKQAAIAFQFFGRNGIEMLNIINENKDSIEGFLKESKRLKGAFDTMDVRQVEAANDAVDKIGSALDGIGKQIAFTISPAIRVFSNQFVTALIKIRLLFERNEDRIKAFIRRIVELAGPVLLQLKSNFVAIFGVISGLFSSVGPLALDIFKSSMVKFFIDIEFATRNWAKVWEIVLLNIELAMAKMNQKGDVMHNNFLKSVLLVKQAVGELMTFFKTAEAFLKVEEFGTLLDPKKFVKDLTTKLKELDSKRSADTKKFQIEMHKLGIKNAERILKMGEKFDKIRAVKKLLAAKREELAKGKISFRESRIADIEKDMITMLKNLDDLLLDFGKARITEPLRKPLEKIELPELAVKGSQAAARIVDEASREKTVQDKILAEEIKQTLLLKELKKAQERNDLANAAINQMVGVIKPFIGGG